MTLPGFEAISTPPREPAAPVRRRRVLVIVCDSLGVGAAPDAEDYGVHDSEADTLGHVWRAVGGLDLPTLGSWGLARVADLDGVGVDREPAAVVARLTPTAAGKDSTSGHWELMGAVTTTPFPTYPEGFPPEVIAAFEEAIGRGVLGNRPASGTEIIEELGGEHLRTGRPIVYTSADSVFQIAVHEDVAEVGQLYAWCEQARAILTGPHRVGRVIARPFRGEPGSFERTAERRDFGVDPPGTTVCDLAHRAGITVVGIGKIEDLFARSGIHLSRHTGEDGAAMEAVVDSLALAPPVLVVANLVDLDQRYGHRNDPEGYALALERIDHWLGEVVAPRLGPGDRLFVTGDHGTDPTLRDSTDHTREFVPAVAWGPDLDAGRDLGTRTSMADLGATVADLFDLDHAELSGSSFAAHLS